jgi:hypothetical protein
MRLRSSGLRRASRRARGRRSRRRVEASGTPLIESRPGPVGPRASITSLHINFRVSLSSSANDDDDDDGVIVEDRSMRSEYWSSYNSKTSASSMSLRAPRRRRQLWALQFKGRDMGLSPLASPNSNWAHYINNVLTKFSLKLT